MSNELVKKRELGIALILQEIADDDLELAQKAKKAIKFDTYEDGLKLLRENDDDQLKLLGFACREDLRIAVDAKLPQKDMPGYLTKALDRVELRWRNGTGEKMGPTVMVAVVNNVGGFSKEDLAKAPIIDVSVT